MRQDNTLLRPRLNSFPVESKKEWQVETRALALSRTYLCLDRADWISAVKARAHLPADHGAWYATRRTWPPTRLRSRHRRWSRYWGRGEDRPHIPIRPAAQRSRRRKGWMPTWRPLKASLQQRVRGTFVPSSLTYVQRALQNNKWIWPCCVRIQLPKRCSIRPHFFRYRELDDVTSLRLNTFRRAATSSLESRWPLWAPRRE